jgi:hypothetical protein
MRWVARKNKTDSPYRGHHTTLTHEGTAKFHVTTAGSGWGVMLLKWFGRSAENGSEKTNQTKFIAQAEDRSGTAPNPETRSNET